MFRGKKLLCVATAALMAVPMMFTGCKNTGSTDTSGKKPVTLTIWFAGDSQQGTSRIEQAVNDHLKSLKGVGSNISIKLQMMGWGDDFETKATNMFTSGGSDADIVFTSNWVDKYRQNASNGYFEPLTKYLKTSEGQEITKLLGEDFLNASRIKGVNYGLPTNKEKAHDWGFLVRSDLFKKYGMDATKIKSITDMEPYFDKAKADGVFALDIAALDSPWHLLDWDMVGDDLLPAAIDASTGKIVNPFTADKSVALYKQMVGYYNKGYISKDATASQGIDADLKTGKYFCGVNSLKPGKDKEESASTGVDYTQIDITDIVKSNRETTGAMLAINKFSTHKQDAFNLIYLLYTDKTLINLINFGQQDKDYSVGSNGSITMTKGSDYAFAQGWMFGDQFKDLLLSTEDPQKWSNFEAYNKKGTALKSLGFMYDDTSTQTQEAALINIVKTYYKQLLAGQADVDKTVAEMTSKLNAAGESTLLADIQKQYDTFLSSKK